MVTILIIILINQCNEVGLGFSKAFNKIPHKFKYIEKKMTYYAVDYVIIR